MKDWLRRVFKRDPAPRGISVRHLDDEQVAEREEQRRREAAAARIEAFDGAPRLPLTEVGEVQLRDELVHLGVAFDDRLIVVGSTADPSATFAGRDKSPGFASSPHSTASERYAIDVELVDVDGGVERRRVDGVPVAHPIVKLAPSGDLVIVGARARWADGRAEHNAWLVSEGGTVGGSFCAADGIQNVQVTPAGLLWVAYFDEGVFGNFGWGNPGSSEPLGRSGLVCWSLDGELRYGFEAPAGFGSIDDCYAMCASGETIWACYYSDFPVVRVGADFDVVGWESGVGGAHAIAATDERALLVGGYRGLFDRAVVVTLASDGRTNQTVSQLVMPDSTDVPDSARLVARGQRLHVVVGGLWLTLDLDKLPL
ncbi:MAG: hypothetical protein AAGC53_09290 [Actinomycetota bacterium]